MQSGYGGQILLAIMIHSYRGGTGKTLLSINLAAAYAKTVKVCLVDFDLRAPSLHGMFNNATPDFWVNDFLNGDCEINEILNEVAPNFYVAFACPDAEAIRDMVGKSRSWETEALNKTVSLKASLEEMGFDKLIFDTAPGLAYSSINAVIASDLVALVMRMDSLDILGTKEMTKGVYELLEKPSFVVVNMVLQAQQKALTSMLEKIFGNRIMGYIPCLCEVKSYIAQGKQILINEDLDYSRAIIKLAQDIEKFAEESQESQ
jgi:MinD-like ATPase involved in chromosome partitioning or flagellar assembly